MKTLILFAFSILSIVFSSFCLAQSTPSFQSVKPAVKGFSKTKLDSLSDYLSRTATSSLLVLVEGKIVYQYGDIHHKHLIHSIRKSILNSLYGIYIENGTIDTTETIGQLQIDDIDPTLSEIEKTATVADLLKSRSGIYHNAAAVSDAMRQRMPKRNSHKPNEYFYYNNWDFNVLGYLLEQKTGKSIYDLFYENIALPTKMEYKNNFTEIFIDSIHEEIPKTDGYYQYELTKSKYPAYHFRMSTHDLAKYGQLYLNNGVWDEKQIIPQSWIETSTKAYSVTYRPAGLGYGMLWKVLMKTERRKNKSFYHTGLGIHMLAIYPAANMVLVHRVDTEKEFDFSESDLRKVISLVWNAKEE